MHRLFYIDSLKPSPNPLPEKGLEIVPISERSLLAPSPPGRGLWGGPITNPSFARCLSGSRLNSIEIV